MRIILIVLLLSFICSANTGVFTTEKPEKTLHYKPVKEFTIPAGSMDTSLITEFNLKRIGDFVSVTQVSKKRVEGYKTSNFDFMKRVLEPGIIPFLDTLKKLPTDAVINTLTIYIFQKYQQYFGPSFYRWGGDLLDLDDPQIQGTRFKGRFGLDCSGFAVSGFELAVYLGLIKLSDEMSLFSHEGFFQHCVKTGTKDVGGRDNASNNYRLDTRDLSRLGTIVFTYKKGSKINYEDLMKVQPGDLVGRDGHFGVVVFINGLPYYLESGGNVLSKSNGNPVPLDKALQIFSKGGNLYVRRAVYQQYID